MEAVISPAIRAAIHLADNAFAAKHLKEDCHDLGYLATALAACLKSTQACFEESEGHYGRQLLGEHLQDVMGSLVEAGGLVDSVQRYSFNAELTAKAGSLVAGFTGVKEELGRSMGRLMGIVGSKTMEASSQDAALKQAALLHQAFKQHLEGTQFNQLKRLQQDSAKALSMTPQAACSRGTPPGPATALQLLAALANAAPAVASAVLKLLPQDTTRALHASCHTGQDIIRLSTTHLTITAAARPASPLEDHQEQFVLPSSDLSATFPYLHSLSLDIDWTRLSFFSDLAARCPKLLPALRHLSVRVTNMPGSHSGSLCQLPALKQLVALCSNLHSFSITTPSFGFSFEAPTHQPALSNLHQPMFEGGTTSASLLAVPELKECLTAVKVSVDEATALASAGLADAPHLRSFEMVECSNHQPADSKSNAVKEELEAATNVLAAVIPQCHSLQELRLACLQLQRFPEWLLQLQQVRTLEVKLGVSLEVMDAVRQLCALPLLQHLHVHLVGATGDWRTDNSIRDLLRQYHGGLMPLLELPTLSSLVLQDVERRGSRVQEAMRAMLQAVSAPQLKHLTLNISHGSASASGLVQVAARNSKLQLPGAISILHPPSFRGASIDASNSQELLELATMCPHLLNLHVCLSEPRFGSMADVVEALRVAGPHLLSLVLSHSGSDTEFDDYGYFNNVYGDVDSNATKSVYRASLDDRLLTAAAEHCTLKLKRLHLSTTNSLSPSGICRMASALHGLEHLALFCTRWTTGLNASDECFKCIAANLTNLRTLELSHTGSATLNGLASLSRMPVLESGPRQLKLHRHGGRGEVEELRRWLGTSGWQVAI